MEKIIEKYYLINKFNKKKKKIIINKKIKIISITYKIIKNNFKKVSLKILIIIIILIFNLLLIK